MDHGLPQGVFYAVFGLTALAIFTVLQLPGRMRRPAPNVNFRARRCRELFLEVPCRFRVDLLRNGIRAVPL